MWHESAGIPSSCKLSEASQSADFMGRGLLFYCQTQWLVGVVDGNCWSFGKKKVCLSFTPVWSAVERDL